MCYRTKDPKVVRAMMDQYANDTLGFYPEEWLKDDRNIAWTNEHGDIGLVQEDTPGICFVHSFFNSRGKQALEAATEMIEATFNNYDVKIMKGLTPIKNIGSRWLNRKLGFTSYGAMETAKEGHCELFIMTKEEFFERNK